MSLQCCLSLKCTNVWSWHMGNASERIKKEENSASNTVMAKNKRYPQNIC